MASFVCLFSSRPKTQARDRARFLSSQHPKSLTHCLTIDYQLCSYNVPARGKFNPIDFRVMNMCFVCVGGGGGSGGLGWRYLYLYHIYPSQDAVTQRKMSLFAMCFKYYI